MTTQGIPFAIKTIINVHIVETPYKTSVSALSNVDPLNLQFLNRNIVVKKKKRRKDHRKARKILRDNGFFCFAFNIPLKWSRRAKPTVLPSLSLFHLYSFKFFGNNREYREERRGFLHSSCSRKFGLLK